MKWTPLNSIADMEEVIQKSFEKPQLIFKHSTRCSISALAKSRLESGWRFEEKLVEPIYLDLLVHRDVSNKIEAHFNIRHESPQVLLIKDGECVYHASHTMINVDSLEERIGH